jgi:hypothetical protein
MVLAPHLLNTETAFGSGIVELRRQWGKRNRHYAVNN